ncbi:unnamed protein product [Chondrus crispus]|uniref:Uncharacterized protein n=1 Tax=Chondrus crispus TaxID=2769 RepID=R7QL10_CHOCR|nr:unnamed protein product [Chondrus crispus]CDF38171.1 unnamed protein product [Chondrus crispus]|eukprot:XP_005718040.1 unnamed protein product [Chondrus crispus]
MVAEASAGRERGSGELSAPAEGRLGGLEGGEREGRGRRGSDGDRGAGGGGGAGEPVSTRIGAPTVRTGVRAAGMRAGRAEVGSERRARALAKSKDRSR